MVTDGHFEVPPDMSLLLKSKVSICLNAFESLTAAWRLGIVDRDVFVEEFRPVFSPRGNEKLLKVYREMLGIYPSITLFEQHLEENNHNPKMKIELAKSGIWSKIFTWDGKHND